MTLLGDNLVEAMSVWLTSDLETYLVSIGEGWAQIEQLVGESGDQSYTTLLDVDTTADFNLPWLAQLVGERLPTGITVPAQREWVKDRPNSIRGTSKAIFLAAQRTLTGDRLVSLKLRTKLNGSFDVDYITVHTLVSQTPDPAKVYADLRKNIVPVDIVLDYSTIIGETWQDVKDDNATWQDVKDDFPNWGEVLTQVSGSSTFQRPVPTYG